METITNKAILKEAWDLFKKKGGFLILAGITSLLINMIMSFVISVLTGNVGLISHVLNFAQIVVSTLITIGILTILLNIVRGKEVGFDQMFTSADPRMIAIYLVTSFLTFLAVGFGTLLLIVPGIIAGLMFMFGTYIVVDKKIGIMASLKESKRITKGHRTQLFLLLLTLLGLNILGILALVLGLFITIPLSALALILAYTKLSAKAERIAGITESVIAEPVVAEVASA